MKSFIWSVCFMCSVSSLFGQDVSSFGQKENYNIRGGIQLGYNFYESIGATQARFAPSGYSISANANVQIGAINIPFNVHFTQLSGSISSPFNLYGASPYYKWIKVHLGNRSLTFSPYVYAGRNFNGVGLELTPGKFRMTAFQGKLRNLLAVSDSVVGGALVLPNYDRKIQGVKLDFGNHTSFFEIMGVRVKDEYLDNIESFTSPQENLVLGTALSLKFFKRVVFQMNVGGSIFTGDQNARRPEDLTQVVSGFDDFHTINATSRFSFAGDATLGYHYKKVRFDVKYRRVNPFYYSLATNFIQNDIENYTFNGNLSLLKSKLRLRGSFGVQNDNLSNHKSFTSFRTIGSASVTYFPNEKFNLMINYSNYQHENQSGLVAVNDTFKILTVTNNFIINGNYKWFKNDHYESSVSMNVFSNNVVDDTDFRTFNNSFSGRGFSVSLPFTIKQYELTLSPIFNVNQYDFSTYDTKRTSIGLTVTKPFFSKKLSVSVNGMFGNNTFNDLNNGTNANASLNLRYRPNKKHQVGMRLFFFDNQNITNPSVTEFRGNIIYGFILK